MFAEKNVYFQHANKIIIGSAGISRPGWLATDKDTLDIVDRKSFLRYWEPGSIDTFMAEHVWEHLTEEEAIHANANCYEFLRPGGRLRIAVPDGFHPNPVYIDYVRPGGTGAGADDHKVLYNYQSLNEQLEKQGFSVNLLEYWDELGQFHFKEWTSEDGHIVRSKRYDPRNQDGSLTYTSLIVDAVKPWHPHGDAQAFRQI
jgi:predicted SAM-dependent methyltransferase